MLELSEVLKTLYVITCLIAINITRRKEQLLNYNNCKFLSVIVTEKKFGHYQKFSVNDRHMTEKKQQNKLGFSTMSD